MTNEEILEAQTLIADMRNILSVLTGTTDAEKLTALVLEKVPSIFDRFDRLGVQNRLTIFGPEDLSLWYQDVAVLLAIAQLAQRYPDYKTKLVAIAATKVPHADAILERIALKLKQRQPL